MKHIVFLTILCSVSGIFSSEKLTVINGTERTICIAYDQKTYAIFPEHAREILYTEKKIKEIELTVINCMAAKTKMKFFDNNTIVMIEINRTISIIQNNKVIGQISV